MAWALIPLLWLLALLLTWMLYRRARLRTPWHLDVAAMGLLAAATLGFFWRVVAGRAWMPADGGDLVSFLFPTYRFAAGMLRSGEWPLWNPYLYTGVPHVGDIQAGFLYPPNLILFLLTPDFPYVTMQWLSIGHIWFAGTGMYLLLVRGLRVGRVPALAGAIAFMFADPFLVHFGNLNLNAVASWLPWIFWPYLIALRKGGLARQPQPDEHVTLSGSAAEAPASSPVSEASHTGERNLSAHASGLSATSTVAVLGWAALSGVLLAVASLAGHIQTTLFIILALGIYTAIWLWLHRQDATPGRRASQAVGSWLVCAVLTVLLIAPVLLPSLQLAGLTGRADWNYQEAAGYSLAPAQWVGWVVPGFFGRSPQYHWGAWPRVETGYVGILTLILAGAALTLRRNRNTWSWAALAGFSFLLALGINAILHGWLTLLPGFGQFRAPARLLVVTDFSLAILAATGLEAAMQPLTGTARSAFDRVWRWVAYAAAGVLLIVVPLVYVIFLLIQDREQTLVVRTSITLGAVMAFAGLLVASLLWLSARRGNWGKPRTLVWLAVGLILLDVASLGAYADLGNEDPSIGFEHPAIAAFLASQPAPFRIDTRTGIDELWQPDTALLYRLEDVTGVANPSTLADSDRYWEELGSRSSRLYDLLNARYVIARKDAPLDWDKFSLVFDGDPDLNVYLNQRAMPRAFTVGQVDAVSGHEEAWTAIHAPDFDPATKAVVEGPALQAGGSGEVHELRSGPGRLSLQVTARGAVLLVISQVWYPGWQVWVDGSPLGEPLRTDYLFQGVLLNEGVHQVELRFAPPLWRLGWILAGLTIAALVVMIVVWLPRRRLRARNSSS
jgi:hypothetical protein